MTHYPYTDFEQAVSELVDSMNIMYGVGVSEYHIQVPSERLSNSPFESADAEVKFFALVEYVRTIGEPYASSEQNVFARVSAEILKVFRYTFNVGQWLAIANALIVGIAEYTKLYGHAPIRTDLFVLHYANNRDEALGIAY